MGEWIWPLPLNLSYAINRDGKICPLLQSFYRFGIDKCLKTVVAFPTAPNMMDLLLTPILGPFGGNQLLTALDAGHPESGATLG